MLTTIIIILTCVLLSFACLTFMCIVSSKLGKYESRHFGVPQGQGPVVYGWLMKLISYSTVLAFFLIWITGYYFYVKPF